MVKFKCLISGTVISFTNPVDIQSTDDHPGYVRVQEEKEQEVVKPVVKAAKKAEKQAESTQKAE